MPIDRPEFRDLVCFNLYTGWRHIQAIYRRAFPEGVTPQRAYLLCACDPDRPTGVGQLIEAIGLDSAGMSGLLGRLEAEGLLRRSVNPDDRREVLVTLTAAGRQLRSECLAALTEADAALQQAISARDVQGLKTVVTQLARLT